MPAISDLNVNANTAPAKGAFSITPSDSNLLSQTTRALYIGTAGDVAVVMADGSAVTFPAMSGGQIYPLQVTKVKSTGTSAANIVGLY